MSPIFWSSALGHTFPKIEMNKKNSVKPLRQAPESRPPERESSWDLRTINSIAYHSYILVPCTILTTFALENVKGDILSLPTMRLLTIQVYTVLAAFPKRRANQQIQMWLWTSPFGSTPLDAGSWPIKVWDRDSRTLTCKVTVTGTGCGVDPSHDRFLLFHP